MKNLTKKIIVYSMVGMMQIGLGTAVVAASPLYNDGPQQIVQLDYGYHHDGDRRWQENRRHEREMWRRDGEDDRNWHERQWRENQRYEHYRHEHHWDR